MLLLRSAIVLFIATLIFQCHGRLLTHIDRPADLRALASTRLWVSDYSGLISTLSLVHGTDGHIKVSKVATTAAPGSPSALTYDKKDEVLYLVDEALHTSNGNGTLYAFRPENDGSLRLLDQIESIGGSVSAVIYGRSASARALAVAHYSKSALSTFGLGCNGALTALQQFHFNLSAVGPVPSRQEAPHPHQVILDPTGNYLIVPDLGADLIRIFEIDHKTGEIHAQPAYHTNPGTGPRHAAFWTPAGDGSYLYVVSELANAVTGYKVAYPAHRHGVLSLTPVTNSSTYGHDTTVRHSALAAEIAIRDNHLYVSNRGDNSFSGTSKPSVRNDSIAVFSLSPSNGHLTFVNLTAANGHEPRYFSLNERGDMVAVAEFQEAIGDADGNGDGTGTGTGSEAAEAGQAEDDEDFMPEEASVVILGRNVETGSLALAPLAICRLGTEKQSTWVIWDE